MAVIYKHLELMVTIKKDDQTCKKIIFVREPNFGKNKCPDNLFGRFSKWRAIRDKVRVFHACMY